MTANLTPTQTEVLKVAAYRPDGNIEPLPSQLRGGARAKVIEGLLARELVTKFHYPTHVEYYLTDAGYAAVGRTRQPPAVAADPEIEAAVSAAEATWQAPARVRTDSKQAKVIELLRRPEGATIRQICEVTGWQNHTVRGMFAGTFKKKLGLAVTSEKPADGDRIYKLA